MKSHFYKVVGQHKEKTYWERVFIWSSVYEIQEFTEHAEALMYEWQIVDVAEIFYRNMEVVQFWDAEGSE